MSQFTRDGSGFVCYSEVRVNSIYFYSKNHPALDAKVHVHVSY